MDFLLLKQQYRIEIGKTVHAAAALLGRRSIGAG